MAIDRTDLTAGEGTFGLHLRKAALCTTWLVLALGLIIVGPRHSPWFDEAQSWLLARDSNPLQIIMHWARYEGSPALWQCILWFFQRVGGRYQEMWMVSALFALGGSLILLISSPFTAWARVGITFSYFFAYQYAIVARSYAIDLFLVPIVATLFGSRLSRPMLYAVFLVLLMQTNAFGFLIGAVLAVELAVQLWVAPRPSPRSAPGAVVLTILGLAAAFLQVWPAPSMQCRCGWEPSATRPLLLLGAAFVENPWPFAPQASLSTLAGPAVTVMLAPPVFALSRAAGRGLLCSGLGLTLAAFVTLIHTLAHHAGMLFLTLIFCLWVCWPAQSRLPRDMRLWLTATLAVLLAYQVADTLGAWAQEIEGPPYSPARAAAAGLEARGAVANRSQIGAIGHTTFAVQPYFDHNILGDVGPPQAAAFYVWRPSEGVDSELGLEGWMKLLSGRRWAWVLAPEPGEPLQTRMEEAARARGYLPVARFEAAMIWKRWRTTDGIARGGDGLRLFERRPQGRAVTSGAGDMQVANGMTSQDGERSGPCVRRADQSRGCRLR